MVLFIKLPINKDTNETIAVFETISDAEKELGLPL